MKVYYRMHGNDITQGEQHLEYINDLADKLHIYMLELAKSRIMWGLRSLEEEMNNSAGMIIIDLPTLAGQIKISIEGFDQELDFKIRKLAPNIRFWL